MKNIIENIKNTLNIVQASLDDNQGYHNYWCTM